VEGPALVLKGNRQVTGLLGDPVPDRVGRHAGQEDLASLEVDEEQHIEPAQSDRVDMEEAFTVVPLPPIAAIVPPWATTTLPGAKGPTPEGAAEAPVGATSTELATPKSVHSGPAFMLLWRTGRLVG
jgi:hypothetical protein